MFQKAEQLKKSISEGVSGIHSKNKRYSDMTKVTEIQVYALSEPHEPRLNNSSYAFPKYGKNHLIISLINCFTISGINSHLVAFNNHRFLLPWEAQPKEYRHIKLRSYIYFLFEIVKLM